MIAALLLLALGQQSDLGRTNGDLSRSAPLQLLDESVRQGAISELNFAGTGVSCTRTSNRGNCSIDAGAAVGDIRLNSTYQTQGTLTLYVDKGGSDSNACTTAATACLTIAGAQAKLPRFLAHNTTINVDAGTYTESVTLQDMYARKSVTLTLAGQTPIAVTPTTGSATGTLTGYAAASPTAIGTLTDSTQSWTTNDLRGRFVRMTSGSANGQRRAIVGNTATVLEIAGAYTANPAAGNSYQIETPSTIISGSMNIGRNVLMSSSTSILFELRQLDLTSASSTVTVDRGFQPAIRFPDSRILSSSSASPALTTPSIRTPTASPTIIMATGSGNAAISWTGRAPATLSYGNAGQPPGAYIYSAGSSAILSSGLSLSSTSAQMTGVIETGSSTAPVISIASGSYLWTLPVGDASTGYQFIRCPSGSTGVGLLLNVTSTNSSEESQSSFGLNRVTIMNCGTGIRAGGGFGVSLQRAITFISTTTALLLQNGATASINAGNPPTFTGVTNEIQVDGTNYTYATLISLSPAAITGAATRTSAWAY